MYKLDYVITTLSPVIVTKNAGDPNMVATEEYISGSSILGALATLYIRQNNITTNAHGDDFFYKCFLSGKIIFSNAYICDEDAPRDYYIPAPLSLQRSKDDTEGKTIYDLLFQDLTELEKSTSYIGGFCNISDTSIRTKEVKRSLHFHHERDYERGTTKKGIIFNYESINEGQTFKGALFSIDESLLKKLVDTFENPLEVTIGRSRSAQYGRAKVEFKDPVKFEPDVDHDDELSLTFTSPAIILNEYGFPSVDINTLQNVLGTGVEIIKAFIRSEPYEGYNSVWRLKKPSDMCISAGSCLLIKAEGEALTRLRELELKGIGQRTNEGFGRFVLGMQREETLSKIEFRKDLKKPSPSMPEEVKKICKSLIQENILKQASLEAIRDAKGFSEERNRPPTKSLISRLEAMIRKDGNMNIDKLRKTAKDKLEDCDNGNTTLLDFLKRDRDSVTKNSLDSITTSHQSFLREINYNSSADEDFKDNLYRQYWLSFFAYMRKALKTAKGGQTR
ncbi:MAG TPA: RAMP superfamily CRISPR-associated protein [Syntrophorhabdaceae bacterium]|nr:RAMP superfamily CRISPR-associated protein [Syntrophorhabdaceae bacterium]